ARNEPRDIGQKGSIVATGKDGVDEALERGLVAFVRLGPTGSRFRLARGFEHVLLDTPFSVLEPSVVGQIIDAAARPRRGPDADERLINQIFSIRVRRKPAFHSRAVPVVETPPASD